MVENLFPEAATALPEPASRGWATFRLLSSETPVPLRHAAGYSAFADYVTASGDDPTQLVQDLPALLRFLNAHPLLLENEALTEAAGIFFGNTLVVLHPRASWTVRSEPEVGTQSRSVPVLTAIRLAIEHPERHGGLLEMLSTWAQDDEDSDQLAQLREHDGQHAVDLTLPPVAFGRPTFPTQVFRNEQGQPIAYGDPDRWPGGPPEEAYERLTHLERFGPLHLEVDAFIGYLAHWYRIVVTAGRDEDGSRVFTLTPEAGATAKITSTPTGVAIAAGMLFEGTFPSCTCDACNENADGAATELEQHLLGIAGGGLRERYPIGAKQWTHVSLQTPSGSTSSSGPLDFRLDTERQRTEVRLRLLDLPDGRWPAWPLDE